MTKDEMKDKLVEEFVNDTRRKDNVQSMALFEWR